jgi:streptogramin lyase
METDRIAHLVVTSTADYSVTEYYTDTLDGGRPYGIVVVERDIWFAQMANDLVSCFTPPRSWVHVSGIVTGLPDEPHSLVVDGLGYVWGTELSGNRVSLFDFGTFPIVVPYSLSPSDSLPTGIAVDASDSLWFTQRGAGQIGRLIRSVPPQKSYYPLPLRGLAPTGIAVDSGGAAWTVSSSDSGGDSFIHRFDPERLFRLFLPIAMKESAQ